MRSLFDVAVWLEPDAVLKQSSTIHRDITERGYNGEQVRAEVDRSGVTFYKSARLAPLSRSEIVWEARKLRSGGSSALPVSKRTVVKVSKYSTSAIMPA